MGFPVMLMLFFAFLSSSKEFSQLFSSLSHPNSLHILLVHLFPVLSSIFFANCCFFPLFWRTKYLCRSLVRFFLFLFSAFPSLIGVFLFVLCLPRQTCAFAFLWPCLLSGPWSLSTWVRDLYVMACILCLVSQLPGEGGRRAWALGNGSWRTLPAPLALVLWKPQRNSLLWVGSSCFLRSACVVLLPFPSSLSVWASCDVASLWVTGFLSPHPSAPCLLPFPPGSLAPGTVFLKLVCFIVSGSCKSYIRVFIFYAFISIIIWWLVCVYLGPACAHLITKAFSGLHLLLC